MFLKVDVNRYTREIPRTIAQMACMVTLMLISAVSVGAPQIDPNPIQVFFQKLDESLRANKVDLYLSYFDPKVR